MRSIAILLCLSLWGAVCRGGDFAPSFPEIGGIISPYTPELVKHSLTERGMHRVEGIWRLTDGTTVAIERDETAGEGETDAIALYRVAILRSSVRSVRPGTVIGYLASSAKAGVYEGRFYTDYSRRGFPSRPKKIIVRLDGVDDRISFDPDRSGWRMTLRHSLPWLFKPTVRYQTDRSRSDLYGGVRVYPAPSVPLEPVYL